MSSEGSDDVDVFDLEGNRRTYVCRNCDVRRPHHVHGEKVEGHHALIECRGECDDKTIHSATSEEWMPLHFEVYCPRCGYETVRYVDYEREDPYGMDMGCQECIGEATTPIEELMNISGVGHSKARRLCDAGIEGIGDVRDASQEDLAQIEGIGNALAARVKADIKDGKTPSGSGRLAYLKWRSVTLQADVED